jgi:SNF family Na+-dependent transporter
MQRGSAGAMRGIIPRLAGVGWAATLSSFFVCMVYNILIGLSLVYMVEGASQPWSKENFVRSMGCNTATMR